MQGDVLGRFRGRRGTNDDLARGAAVEALTEVIQSRRASGLLRRSGDRKAPHGPPTAAEYFAAIMATLEASSEISSQVVNLCFLLSVVLPELHKAVLRKKSHDVLDLAFTLLKKEAAESENDAAQDSKLTRYCLVSIGVALAAEEESRVTWNRQKEVQALGLLVRSAADTRPKVRKIAQSACVTVLEQHAPKVAAPLKLVCDLACKTFKACTVNECAGVMRLLYFMVVAAPHIVRFAPRKYLVELLQCFCGLIVLGHPQLACNALKATSEYSRLLEQNKAFQHGESSSAGLLVKLLSGTITTLAHGIDDPKLQRIIVSNQELCQEWVNTLQVLELEYRKQGESAFPEVTKACIACVSSGLRFSAETGKAAISLLSVAMPLGCIVRLMQDGPMDRRNIQESMTVLSKLLGQQFEDSWPLSLEVFRYFFTYQGADRIGVKRITEEENRWIESLTNIRESIVNPVTGIDDPKIIVKWRGAVERAIKAAVAHFGATRVLSVVSLRGSSPGVSPSRLWLVSLLRASIGTGTATESLEYFRSFILNIAEECEHLAAEAGCGENSAKALKMRAMQLWSLLPGFCSNTSDIADAKGLRALAPVLAQALENDEYPELVPIVCQSMTELISQAQGDENECEVMSSLARNFLPLLFNLYDKAISIKAIQQAQAVHVLISKYSLIAEAQLVNTLFRQLVQQLITVSRSMKPSTGSKRKGEPANGAEKDLRKLSLRNEDKNECTGNEEEGDDEEDDEKDALEEPNQDEMHDVCDVEEEQRKLHVLTSLALALVPALDEQSINLLYRVVQPFLEDEEDQSLQKKGYRVLESICEHKVRWTVQRREELLKLLQDAFFAASVGSKTARLRCMVHVTKAIASEDANLSAESVREMLSGLLGEAVLSLKEVNTKARASGFRLIIEMAHCLQEVYARREDCAKDEGLRQYLHMLVGGLAAQTPHMRSAALNSLARFFGEFHSVETIQNDLMEVAQASMLLLQEKSREVAKSAIGFVKVCAIRLPVETLQKSTLVKDMLEALLPWANDSKNRFSLKIRVIVERLSKRLGLESVLACGVLSEDHKLIVYIKKQAAYKRRRNERKLDGETFENFSARKENDSDSDDLEENHRKLRPGKRKRASRDMESDEDEDADVIMDESGGDALDLLGPAALSKVKRRVKKVTNKNKNDEEFKFAADGRLVIPDEDSDDENESDSVSSRKAKRRKAELSDDEFDHEIGQKKAENRSKDAKRKDGSPGAGFKAKKAGGDVRKKNSNMEPYAYIKLDPRMLNRRRRHDSARQFRGLSGKRFKNKSQKPQKR